MQAIEKLRFLNEEETRKIASTYGTPVFVYSEQVLEERARLALQFPNAFGLTVRYAMKANPNVALLQLLRKLGIQIDASSEYEVERAKKAGFSPQEIMLTSQEFAKNFRSLVESGVFFNACSLRQLEEFGKAFPGGSLSLRFNPGLGSGHTKKTDVGGVNSSFGIWHEKIPEVLAKVSQYNLKVQKVHTHIGSGSDPEVWKAVASVTLEIAEKFPTASIVNLGGGYKVGRMVDEASTDLQKIGEPVKELFLQFAKNHDRKLHLEIEPGTFLIALAGSLVTTVDDKVDTGSKGFTFLKLDTGMDANTRPSLYGAKHPLVTVPKEGDKDRQTREYVVVGHCCESGDLFTQKEGGEAVTRHMLETQIGDLVVMEGVGAYCSGMSTKNYNSFPETPEVLFSKDGNTRLIRKKQTLDQILQCEISTASY